MAERARLAKESSVVIPMPKVEPVVGHVRARISRAWLMAGGNASGSWHRLGELPLADG